MNKYKQEQKTFQNIENKKGLGLRSKNLRKRYKAFLGYFLQAITFVFALFICWFLPFDNVPWYIHDLNYTFLNFVRIPITPVTYHATVLLMFLMFCAVIQTCKLGSTIHEGLHSFVLCRWGDSSNILPFATDHSVHATKVAKNLWIKMALFPLFFPLTILILLVFLNLSLSVIAFLVFLSGSYSDIIYVVNIIASKGEFVDDTPGELYCYSRR
jgi:hypothetical protein